MEQSIKKKRQLKQKIKTLDDSLNSVHPTKDLSKVVLKPGRPKRKKIETEKASPEKSSPEKSSPEKASPEKALPEFEKVDIIIEKENDNPLIPNCIEPKVEKAAKLVTKHIIQSKIIWVNVIMLISFILHPYLGMDIPLDLQAELLTIINIILRTLSSSKLTIK